MHPTQNLYRRPKRPIVIPARVAGRAATRWEQNENNCWISTYSTASHGYAQIGWHDDDGHRCATTAHRAAWVDNHGEQVPEGMTVDHTCKERRCVNPAHLRLMSNFENARRTDGRDWPEGECINGHPNSELFWDGSRWRCQPCTRESQRRYYRRHPDRVKAANDRYNAKRRARKAP